MRVLGLDVGDRRIGIALSDELGLTAPGLTVRNRRNTSTDLTPLQQIITHQQVERIVVPATQPAVDTSVARGVVGPPTATPHQGGWPLETSDATEVW